jgi:hypothetical protein
MFLTQWFKHELTLAKSLLNTVKYIKMACSSNFGNVFSVLSTFYVLVRVLNVTI